ncbi:MAG: sulfite exporter TauE/SafE family protein [Clostridia bacterium]|nr:sulfite exporter TauE/SafE family protein [Clostridia bacterium]
MIFVDIIAAALAALLSGLGAGSGGLLVIYLTLAAGMEQQAAQGVNLLFFLFSGGAALAVHAARRRLFPGVILTLVLSGILGSLLGSAMAGVFSPLLLRRLFGGMLVVSGILSFRRPAGRSMTERTE